MAVCTFNEAMTNSSSFVLRPGCKNENNGYFSDIRVNRTTLPAGWYAYDIRDSDAGNFCTIEKNYVMVNHGGTFLTQTPVTFPKNKDYMNLCGRGGYSFL